MLVFSLCEGKLLLILSFIREWCLYSKGMSFQLRNWTTEILSSMSPLWMGQDCNIFHPCVNSVLQSILGQHHLPSASSSRSFCDHAQHIPHPKTQGEPSERLLGNSVQLYSFPGASPENSIHFSSIDFWSLLPQLNNATTSPGLHLPGTSKQSTPMYNSLLWRITGLVCLLFNASKE